MFLRIDRLPVQLPASTKVDPESASAVQELMGGRFGEMSTFNNYFTQSMNLRGKPKLGAFYELVANIAAEELGHIELVGAAINSLLNGPAKDVVENGDKDPLGTPIHDLTDLVNNYNPHHFIAGGRNALPVDAGGLPWNGTYVFSSGNLILDLLHNFFLENAARTNKLRVYQMTKDPAAREMLGYLFVRGGVHAVAYGKALEKLTGVKMNDMLPIPKIGNEMFPEAKKYMDQANHTKLYRMSPSDYKKVGEIWNGPHPDGGECVFLDGPPTDTAGNHVDLAGISSAFAPEYHPQEIFEMAQQLYKKAKS
ncbi:MAG: Mn-containing catalase [Phycisphaerales bacterium]|jgi:Mn-containing catalase|nr:Mn-containing catalase [Phycisphaerales bacterium]MEA2733770.1 Mn-containing catalase [Humisphaera sp.]